MRCSTISPACICVRQYCISIARSSAWIAGLDALVLSGYLVLELLMEGKSLGPLLEFGGLLMFLIPYIVIGNILTFVAAHIGRKSCRFRQAPVLIGCILAFLWSCNVSIGVAWLSGMHFGFFLSHIVISVVVAHVAIKRTA